MTIKELTESLKSLSEGSLDINVAVAEKDKCALRTNASNNSAEVNQVRKGEIDVQLKVEEGASFPLFAIMPPRFKGDDWSVEFKNDAYLRFDSYTLNVYLQMLFVARKFIVEKASE